MIDVELKTESRSCYGGREGARQDARGAPANAFAISGPRQSVSRETQSFIDSTLLWITIGLTPIAICTRRNFEIS